MGGDNVRVGSPWEEDQTKKLARSKVIQARRDRFKREGQEIREQKRRQRNRDRGDDCSSSDLGSLERKNEPEQTGGSLDNMMAQNDQNTKIDGKQISKTENTESAAKIVHGEESKQN